MNRKAGAFDWLGELPADEEVGTIAALHVSDDFGEQWAHEVDRLVALDVQEAMAASTEFRDVQQAQADEHCWSIDFRFGDKPARISLQWIPGSDQDNRFAFETDFIRSFWQRLLRQPVAPPETQQRVFTAIANMLRVHHRVERLSLTPEI